MSQGRLVETDTQKPDAGLMNNGVSKAGAPFHSPQHHLPNPSKAEDGGQSSPTTGWGAGLVFGGTEEFLVQERP